jgi:hypothetical protein
MWDCPRALGLKFGEVLVAKYSGKALGTKHLRRRFAAFFHKVSRALNLFLDLRMSDQE